MISKVCVIGWLSAVELPCKVIVDGEKYPNDVLVHL